MAEKPSKNETAGGGGALVGSLTNTVNLVVAGVAAVGAAALHSLPILALGGATFTALVAWDLVSGRRKGAATNEPPMPEEEDLTDPALREVVQSLELGRKKLDQVLKETPESVKGFLGGVIASMEEMEKSSARLLHHAEALSRYLATTDKRRVHEEIKKLDGKAAATRDAETQKQYAEARSLREEQKRALDDIEAARERVLSNLSRIVATLDGLAPKIVRMRALDAQAMDALSGNMSDELGRVNDDMAVFEETLQGLGEIMK